MAAKQAFRYMSRRLSSSGKILSEEEKAAENVYIKKVEKEKLEKLARKAQADATSATSGGGGGGGGGGGEAKGSGPAIGVSEDKNRNYAVIAGVVTAVGALGWYLKSKNKKSEDLHD
ncbi:uncharacterized protein At2g27730, mitochondrial [Lactuca sativa]|uniref:Uncharacterized protein n=1 Tax=Lactuca sativa TaxID=4236 RepID=A0A9R1W4U2_LACSA|nr:uncharacterized protein At2g27730, mitochondrial [Lactuca sativa]XP_023768954.1 uncharacterized protein At2g27730, mitochondrial [Lactuca sativa]KAJ0219847.1 hypothetical protein LSAT_V11C200071520 [Lactuca sativa]